MRTQLFSFAAAIGCSFFAQAQSMGDVLNNGCTVTWVGLDFSNAKFVPAVEFVEVQADPQLAMLKWNNLLEQEPAKFDLGKALGITRCVTNTSFMGPVNQGFTADDLLGREPYSLDREGTEMVRDYKTEGDGVGVVFIVSTFDKTQSLGEFHVTFFNMKTKEVLYSERISGKPIGFGMRNFWAGSVYAVLKEIEKTYIKAWRARFK